MVPDLAIQEARKPRPRQWASIPIPLRAVIIYSLSMLSHMFNLSIYLKINQLKYLSIYNAYIRLIQLFTDLRDLSPM